MKRSNFSKIISTSTTAKQNLQEAWLAASEQTQREKFAGKLFNDAASHLTEANFSGIFSFSLHFIVRRQNFYRS